MKCPICGQQLRPSKKDPDYLLCYDCKKKFKNPAAKKEEVKETREVRETEQKYSNIPPKSVREKRETEMRKAYDEMLAVGDGKKKKAQPQPKVKKREVYKDVDLDDNYDDNYDDDYYDDDDEKLSKAPIIILGIAILAVAAVIVYMLVL